MQAATKEGVIIICLAIAMAVDLVALWPYVISPIYGLAIVLAAPLSGNIG